ncbi:MAG: acyl-CoA dehydrogenase family protein, partial [Micromonosporaceae bacterium]
VSAARDGDTYRVRGAKTMITHARHADPIAVLVVTDPAAQPRHHGMSVLMVEAATPGYTVSRDISKLGHRGVELCELSFDDARVPAGNLLGGVAGMGFRQMMSALDRGRVYMAAASVGIARASYEAAARHAHEREAFGSPIADFQAVKLRIAAMTTRITAARLLTLDAARQVETRGRANSAAAMAKVFASEAAIDCSLDAMRILGGYGYTTEFPVERYFRDAPVMAIGEGANDILQLLIADESLKRREV